VTGSVTYQVIGWVATRENGGFLIPMTVVNLASLFVLLKVMFKVKGGDYQFDPLEPNSLISASPDIGKRPLKWEDTVEYRREVPYFHR
jgi:hypothetical protein